MDTVDEYLRPTRFLDSDHPSVVEYAREATGDAATDVECGVRLFYRVRDGIRYDPYRVSGDPDDYVASAVVRQEAAFCVPKAVLLAASARAAGIPARLAFADVRNHLQSERLRQTMRTDLFVFHGIAELHLDGRWVKATPAFNVELCERFGVRPLEFDGRTDALFHPYDAAGRRHMEYVRDRGSYADLPFEEMMEAMRATYASAQTESTAGPDPMFDPR